MQKRCLHRKSLSQEYRDNLRSQRYRRARRPRSHIDRGSFVEDFLELLVFIVIPFVLLLGFGLWYIVITMPHDEKIGVEDNVVPGEKIMQD